MNEMVDSFFFFSFFLLLYANVNVYLCKWKQHTDARIFFSLHINFKSLMLDLQYLHISLFEIARILLLLPFLLPNGIALRRISFSFAGFSRSFFFDPYKCDKKRKKKKQIMQQRKYV